MNQQDTNTSPAPPPIDVTNGISLIIPAHNEEQRISAVLQVAGGCRFLDEIIVVNDGSTDGTSAQARRHDGVIVFDLPRNLGKGGAMYAGVALSRRSTLVFLDADLVGLQTDHVERLAEPVADDQADMSIALFHGGRFSTDFSHLIAAWVTGQRAVKRHLLLDLPHIALVRSGVETVITRQAREASWKTRKVPWEGVTHVMREEKLGKLRGFRSRLQMYGDISRALLDGEETVNCRALVQEIREWIETPSTP